MGTPGIWDKLAGLLLGCQGPVPERRSFRLWVECGACGERIGLRVDRDGELERLYGGNGEELVGYELHKDVLGSQCQNLMHLHVRLDAAGDPVAHEVTGGRLLSRREAEAASDSGA